MKPLFLDKSNKLDSSFSIKFGSYQNFLKVWHYHSELELVVIVKSTGTKFIGNHIDQFSPGELILIGKDLPHMWVNDAEYFKEDSKLKAEAVAIHFKENFAGNDFFKIPELVSIAKLFERAKFGIKFNGENKKKLIKKIEALMEMNNFNRLVHFLDILYELSKDAGYELLSSPSFTSDLEKADKLRLEPVYNFIVDNYKTGFTLTDIAKVAHMNPSAFSRFFKKVHRKTLTKYVNELRVGYACKLLMENKYSMTRICYDSGFNNLSNFNRQFKNILSYSPSEYLKKHVKSSH